MTENRTDLPPTKEKQEKERDFRRTEFVESAKIPDGGVIGIGQPAPVGHSV